MTTLRIFGMAVCAATINACASTPLAGMASMAALLGIVIILATDRSAA